VLALALSLLCRTVQAAAGGPSLPQPPHGELQPTFWEQHSLLAILLCVAVLVVSTLFIVLLRRPKLTQGTPPEILARRSLEALRGSPEDAELADKVSRILRQHASFAFQLPAGELTTAEIDRAIGWRPQIAKDLRNQIVTFLRRCDQRKFAPTSPTEPQGMVDAAKAIFELIEQYRLRPPVVVPPPSPESVTVGPAVLEAVTAHPISPSARSEARGEGRGEGKL
jgi:hypothetical protein